MTIEGRLGNGGVADLLSAIWEQERTCIVDLVAGAVDRKFVISSGDVVYLLSADNAEKLPHRLLAQGIVARERLIAATKAGPDLRQSLAASGALSAEAHDSALRALIEEVVVKLFAVTDGRYVIVDRNELSLPGILPSNPMVPVFWRAAKVSPPIFVEGFLGDQAQRVLKHAADQALLEIPDMSPQQGYLLSRIDGYCSVRDVVGMSPVPAEETLRFLVALTCIGAVDVTGRPGVKLPKPAKSGTRSAKKKVVSAAPKAAAASAGTATAAATAPAPTLPVLKGMEAVRDMLARLAGANHYSVLAVPSTAESGEIRKAYYALARVFHPDRFAKDMQIADRQVVEELFSRIGEAFATLSDDERRVDYDNRLKSGALEQEMQNRKPVDRKELARESYDKGRALLAGGDKGRALGFFEHAVETDQDNWDFRMALGKLLLADPRLRRRAEGQFQEAIRIDQSKADAYYFLAILYKSGGVKSRALQQLRTGLKWDASHEGINKELAELENS